MLFCIFVRSVEDGLEPSQTYDEVNKLLLLLLLLHAHAKDLVLITKMTDTWLRFCYNELFSIENVYLCPELTVGVVK